VAKKNKKPTGNVKKKTITAKNSKFLDLYVSSGDLSKSWVDSGYSDSNASSCAAKCLKKPHIKREYNRRLKIISKKVDFDALDVINELGIIAFANSDDYMDWHEVEIDIINPITQVSEKQIVSKAYLKPGHKVTRKMRAAISGIKEGINGIELKFHNKGQALESLKKYFGIDTEAEVKKAKKIKEAGADEGKTDGVSSITFVFNEKVKDES